MLPPLVVGKVGGSSKIFATINTLICVHRYRAGRFRCLVEFELWRVETQVGGRPGLVPGEIINAGGCMGSPDVSVRVREGLEHLAAPLPAGDVDGKGRALTVLARHNPPVGDLDGSNGVQPRPFCRLSSGAGTTRLGSDLAEGDLQTRFGLLSCTWGRLTGGRGFG